MYHHVEKQPGSLESSVVPKIGDWIVSQAEKLLLAPNMLEDLFFQLIEAIRHYLCLPQTFCYTIAARVLQTSSKLLKTSEAPDRYEKFGQMIEILIYSQNLTTLQLKKDVSGIDIVSLTESHKLIRLTCLEISGSEETAVIMFLRNLPSLKIFKCTENSSVDVYRCLVENCKLIEELPFPFSGKITLSNQCTELMTQLPFKTRHIV